MCITSAVLFNRTCKTGCPEGYYRSLQATSNHVNTYSCQPCSSNCRACYGDSYYECWTCNTGYFLYFWMCLTSCPPGYFADNTTMRCKACPASCKLCYSSSNCSVCQVNYTLSSTAQCSQNQTCNAENCITCLASSTSQCAFCIDGYSLYNHTCVTSCPSGTYSSSGICLLCTSYCSECS